MYINHVIESSLTFEEAYEHISTYQKTSFVTRPEWKGVHFMSDNRYYILLKTGEVIEVKIEDVESKNKHDWSIVTITDEAVEILLSHCLV